MTKGKKKTRISYRGGVTREAALVGQLPGILGQLRAAYLREVETLAGELQVQFEAGTLHGYRDDGDAVQALRKVCELRFALGRLSAAELQLLLAASPSSALTADGVWKYLALHAAEAIAYDVLRVAVSRGWHRPTKDEAPSAKDLRLGRAARRGRAS